MSICANGLAPTYGAGFHKLYEHFAVPVPGVYVSPNFDTALRYPQNPHTNSKPIIGHGDGVSGGEFICTDGTPPLRVVVRVVGDVDERFWFRKDKTICLQRR